MIRKVFLATINYDHPQKGMSSAFRSLFPEVTEYDYLERERKGQSRDTINKDFVEQASDFKPDWIWLQLQETGIIRPESLLRVREVLPATVITHWMGDCRETVGEYSASISRASHLTLLSNVGQLPLYEETGAPRVRYCQIGLDWEEDILGLPDWTPPFQVPDVVFCANYYGDKFPGTAERVEALDALARAGLWVGIVGRGWPSRFPVLGSCGVKQQYHVWSRAKVCLSINNFNDIERYYSDRQLISMASGTPVVCRYVPGLEKEFTHGEECLWYRTPSELVTYVAELLKSDSYRASVGAKGRAAVIRRHTWWNRIFDLVPDIEFLRSRRQTADSEHRTPT